MTRIISHILGAPEPAFSRSLAEWERRSGQASHDVRLVSDMRQRAKQATEELGFDMQDTTAREIYFALQHRLWDDNHRLAVALNIEDTDTPLQMIEKIIKWLENQDLHNDVWVMKPSVIRTLFRKQAPKQLMKTLGLRSVDSMLKRNTPQELLPLAFKLENPEWSQKLRLRYKRLKPKDFQVKPIGLCVLQQERVDKLHQVGYPVSSTITPCYELGSISIIPPKRRYKGDVVAITASILETTSELRRHSAYYRALSVRKDFGSRFAETCEHGIVNASRQLSHVGWSSFHKHLIGNEEFFRQIEQPHLAHEDMLTSHAVHVLQAADPKFAFWEGLDFVFVVSPQEPPVSMHLIDVATNASNHLDHSRGISSYGQARLWDELWSRYLLHEPLARSTTSEFFGESDFL